MTDGPGEIEGAARYGGDLADFTSGAEAEGLKGERATETVSSSTQGSGVVAHAILVHGAARPNETT